MRILVVEDDRLLNNTLCYNLNTAGYVVDSALTKSAASDFLTKQDYDLIVLDVNLPDGNGFDFCREVKERRPDTAVIFLTANDMESDMLKGYELGAEDYVTKPFSMQILLRKIGAVLRRSGKISKEENTEDLLCYGNLRLDLAGYQAWEGPKKLELTQKEFELLREFLENQGRVLTRNQLLDAVWGADYFGEDRIVDTHIKNLRKKLEADYIDTIRGVGYRIDKIHKKQN